MLPRGELDGAWADQRSRQQRPDESAKPLAQAAVRLPAGSRFPTTSLRGRTPTARAAGGPITKRPPVTDIEIQAMRDAIERTRMQHSPQDHACLADMVEILAELRTMVLEFDGDDDTPVDGEFLARAIERARARTSR